MASNHVPLKHMKKCIQEAGLAGRGNNNPKVKFNIPQEKLVSPDWPFKEAVNETHRRSLLCIDRTTFWKPAEILFCNCHAGRSFSRSAHQHTLPVYKIVCFQTRSWSVPEKCSDKLIRNPCFLAGTQLNLVEHQNLPVGSIYLPF